ncbi:MAG: carbonic anhydrase, partial [Acidimicrobiales bacterium]
EEVLASEIETSLGERPPFRLGAYDDVEEDVRATIDTLTSSPFVDGTEIRGFVFNVDDGALREIVSRRTS